MRKIIALIVVVCIFSSLFSIDSSARTETGELNFSYLDEYNNEVIIRISRNGNMMVAEAYQDGRKIEKSILDNKMITTYSENGIKKMELDDINQQEVWNKDRKGYSVFSAPISKHLSYILEGMDLEERVMKVNYVEQTQPSEIFNILEATQSNPELFVSHMSYRLYGKPYRLK